ncbi:MBL fold metallo-hydrolase [Parashewanella spongiae]|uniref:beta-lactamase n=1 Tax=Parashewanella spongiae TaxID=342950 RepID=A0A3A6U2E5_9GAMM|nr:MBL fold metallo-hydrolase [Parashewanella spongiae]MCL1077582.1 MBL fold metallo-hydrolase [Parashewanella spongiae]RJY18206.1 MBL fold metallo-hydrolase [Parashewanella spongiae]
MKHIATVSAAIALLFSINTHADDRFKDIKIVPQKLTHSTYMFTGAGGNIGVSAGEDGILIIDDQFAPLADKIEKALSEIQVGEPKYIINTHYHGDHTGGNEHFSQSGTIMAHHNVLKRLQSNPKVDQKALPVITYDDGISIHFNGTTMNVVHLKPGHTDGDSVVYWSDDSVVHMGDLFFKDHFPYVDLKGGGSVIGYRDNVAAVLKRINKDTKVIPGHGTLAAKDDLMKFKIMLDDSINWMQQQLVQEHSLEKMKKQGLPASLQAWSWSFITEDKWIETLYYDLKK